MKTIKILCICFGIFLCNTTIQTGAGMFALNAAKAAGRTAVAAGKGAVNYIKGFARTDAEVWGERLNMAFDMGMPMGVGMAASNANEFLSEEQAAVFADFKSESSAITDALKSWRAEQKKLADKQTDDVNSYFTTQFTTVSNSQADAQKIAHSEANYLFQNLSLAKPANFLTSVDMGGQFDQMFSDGIMATPTSNFTWYNALGIGDWLYDPLSKSFWQNQAVPFSTTDNMSAVSSNNIFVEYYPSQKPYTIAGSFTLYKITYPFFVGIMFNKNRWISGNMEIQNKCRVLGIYATSTTTAGIYFAEQYELSNDDARAENASNPTPIKKPLIQIIDKHVNPLAPISDKILVNVKSEPVTFNFKITTSPTTASCKIWAATDKEPAQAFLIQNLDSSLYLYHTLGFMSPGAATEWKITAPKELTFSPQAIINFKNKVFPLKP